MARVRKRGDNYQIDYIEPSGKRIRMSFSRRKEITKTKNRREIPVNDEFDQALKKIRKERGLTPGYFFTYARRPSVSRRILIMPP